jgi:hypothetical protein
VQSALHCKAFAGSLDRSHTFITQWTLGRTARQKNSGSAVAGEPQPWPP